MSESPILEFWPEGIAAARIPANNNVRLVHAYLLTPVISASTTAQPTPVVVDGDPPPVYIIPAGATGPQWGTFAEGDVAIYYEATWTSFVPFEGLRKTILDEGTDGENWQYLGGVWAAESGGGGGSASVGVQYVADTGSTADSDPGPGLLKWNNAAQASATVLYLDDLTADGVSLAGWWTALTAGGFCYLQHATDQDTWQISEITTVTDAAGYVKLACTILVDGGAFADGDPMMVTLEQGAGVGGGVTSVDASGGVETASGSPISSTGTIRGSHTINAQTGTSYAIVAGDRGKQLTLSNAASIAVTIAQAGTTGFEDGYFVFIENIGVGASTITPTTSTINGAATVVLDSGMSGIMFSDGTNYRVILLDQAGITVNPQTGTSYTYLSGDRGKLVSHANAAAIAGTLPQATGAFGARWFTYVQNMGAGTLTITPTTSTIDGAASLALPTGQGVTIASDGTNYYTIRGAAVRTQSIQIACSDLITNISAGTNKAYFRMPYPFTLTGVRASVFVAQTAGSILTFDINENGATILSTKLTIDNAEKTSTTAATPAVISDSSLADDAEIIIDFDQVGTALAKGVIITLIGYPT